MSLGGHTPGMFTSTASTLATGMPNPPKMFIFNLDQHRYIYIHKGMDGSFRYRTNLFEKS